MAGVIIGSIVGSLLSAGGSAVIANQNRVAGERLAAKQSDDQKSLLADQKVQQQQEKTDLTAATTARAVQSAARTRAAGQ